MDAGNTVAPGRTYVYLADTGTAAPADSSVALAVDWVNVGHTTPDSMSFSTEPEFEEIRSAQSDYPIRRFQVSESASIQCDLLEWSGANFQFVFGGGTVTEPVASSGEFKYVPPTLGGRQEKACVLEIIDDAKHYRYVFPRVQQVEGVEAELGKGAASVLPLRLAVLGEDAVDPWYLLTDDPAFTPVP